MKTIVQKNNSSIRWDAHGCPPFKIGADLSFLNRYKNSGVNFISLNIGFDLTTKDEAIALINYFHEWIAEHNQDYDIIKNTEQLTECFAKNKLAIAFDIEGSNLLDGHLENISRFYTLGVRQIAFVYNTNNLSGGGCLDKDIGLTNFGKAMVEECNNIGMVIDCSHVGYQTSIDIINLSEHPIVFSHSNPKTIMNHPRNITDEQIILCAKKGGVIGINGIGIFLDKNNDTSAQKMVEHIDYVAQKVGVDHVGLGLDCVFAPDEVKSYAQNNPLAFPSQYGFNDVAVAQPEQFAEFSKLLAFKKYSNSDIDKILGGNFLRIAQTVWK